MSELILYTSEDGITRVDRHTKEGELAENAVVKESLTTAADGKRYKKTISEHIQNLFSEGELRPEATVKESLTVQIEGKREARRTIQHYNLDLILAIGYRVRSPRGTQFRQWATTHLREYLVKGFVMDDQRLKNPGGWDYFRQGNANIPSVALRGILEKIGV